MSLVLRLHSRCTMSELDHLKQGIQNLSRQELAQFREWFVEFDHRIWDKQIEAHSKSGKFDGLVAKALADFKLGKAREI